jgi:O-antigen biosynthesis protein WbqP
MSFVGPRPSLPSQTELIAARERLGVHRLRPGITGISQLAGLDMSDPERLAQMDSVYLHRNGVLVDLEIIVKTALNRGGGDAVTL